jgi:hypothetical protein
MRHFKFHKYGRHKDLDLLEKIYRAFYYMFSRKNGKYQVPETKT